MPKKKKKKSPPPLPGHAHREDPRPAALFHIAWVSLAMLGISIPLSPTLGQFIPWTAPALPALIIASALLCSVAVWNSKGRQPLVDPSAEDEYEVKISRLESEIEALSERLNSLETIQAFEARFNTSSGVVTDTPPAFSREEEAGPKKMSV
ncbi:MAG: hypothetical protein HRU46_13425 [Verrucomicrobiales bacterium]|nr:hypothetical protein [Verrucomicrobiales bacterium]